MKIMYLLYSFTVGGSEKLTVDICNELSQRNNDIYLYIVNKNYSIDLLNTLNSKIHVELQNRIIGNGNRLQTIWKITRYIQKNKIDVIHCNAFATPEVLFLHNLCFRNVKIIHTIHDVGQYKKLNKWKIIYRNNLCDNFIAISKSVQQDIIKYGADSSKVSIIYNAINLGKFKVKQNCKTNNTLVIGNVARIIPEKKGQDILIDAFHNISEDYPNTICCFAGGYDPLHKQSYENLKRKVTQYKLDHKIKFMGNVDDIPKFLQKVDIFVLPSRFEGFGISLIEAMSMGIPCVASNLDGPAEIIGKNERGFLFEPENIRELESQLRFVLDNYENIKRLQKNNIKYVKNNFDIKIMCNKLLEIYQKK